MKDKLTKDLDIKAFLVVYSILSIIAYVALYSLFVGTYDVLTDPFDYYKFPVISAVGVGIFICIKIFLTFIFINDKSENANKNLTAVIETEFSFLLIFLLFLIPTFTSKLSLLLSYFESATKPMLLIGVFAGTLFLTGGYNILTISSFVCRREIYCENGLLHFFILPTHFILILVGLYMEFVYILTYGSFKFNTQWWEFVYSLALYTFSFIFVVLLAKKGKLTGALPKHIFTVTIVIRMLYIFLWICLLGFDELTRLAIILLMSVPCISGAFIAKRIASKNFKSVTKEC